MEVFVKKTAITLLLLVSTGWAQKKFQPLNVKPGLWESTTSVTTSGQLPMPAEYLNKLTPEQRARFEQAMKAHSAPRTTSHTQKACETKEKLQESPFNDQKECKQTLITSTSSRAEVNIMCQFEDVTTRGHMNIEAISAESVKGTGEMTSSGGGHTMNNKVSFTAKWLGSSCGSVK